MNDILSKEELIELTAAKQARKQKRVLSMNGIRYFEDSEGHPKVFRSSILETNGNTAYASEVDWSAVDKAVRK